MASEEKPLTVYTVPKSGKTLKIGNEVWPIIDPGVDVKFVDFLTEGRHFNGVVYLAFAHAIIDAGNPVEAVISSRLRMTLPVAQDLHHVLGNMIADALKPVEKPLAN